jgi:hypothetical protein
MSCRLSVEGSDLTWHNYLSRVAEADSKCQVPNLIAPRYVGRKQGEEFYGDDIDTS